MKTALFSLSDQAQDHPPAWGDGFGGYAQRAASRYGQFIAQNALSATGNALLGYELRYARCRCSGFWPRAGHAVLRNFLTYNRTEKELRLQFAMYAAAFGAGAIAGTWQPERPSLVTKGYQGVITQTGFWRLRQFSRRIRARHHARSQAEQVCQHCRRSQIHSLERPNRCSDRLGTHPPSRFYTCWVILPCW